MVQFEGVLKRGNRTAEQSNQFTTMGGRNEWGRGDTAIGFRGPRREMCKADIQWKTRITRPQKEEKMREVSIRLKEGGLPLLGRVEG